MLYIIIGGVFLVALVIASIKLYQRGKKKKETTELVRTIKEKHPELLVDKSATELVKQFMWYVKSEESEYNRQQRRRINRHYIKFLYKWWEIPKKARDVQKIVSYLAQQDRNNRVVHTYVQAYITDAHENAKARVKEKGGQS